MGLDFHHLALLVKEVYKQVEWQLTSLCSSVQAVVPSLTIVVGADALHVHTPITRRPDRVGDPSVVDIAHKVAELG